MDRLVTTPTRPRTPQSPVHMQVLSPAGSSSGSIATSTCPRTPQSHLQVPSPAGSQVSSPVIFIELGQLTPPPSASCSSGGSKSSSKSRGRKRKLVYNVLDPELERIGNHGSDRDSDSDDEDDDEFGFMQCPRAEWIALDLLDEGIYEPPSAQQSDIDVPQQPTYILPSSTSVSSNEKTYFPRSLNEFSWEPLPQPAIFSQSRREAFTATVGPTSIFLTPYDAYVSIWDHSIMEYIAVETNQYADQSLKAALDTGELGGYSRKLKFTDTDVDELYVYFALVLATGMVIKNDLTEYWSAQNDVFDTPNFGRYMSYTRFVAITRMLHFVNNEVDISHLSKSEAKIYKISPIINHLNEKFQALYNLGQSVALDESLTQWKGWLSINQFIKTKAAGVGVKTYEICDSGSGYLWRFKVHAGRNEGELQELGYLTSLVLDLLEGLENKGHTIFMDNYYNSPLLARILKSKGFDCVGTLRLNRQNVPQNLKDLVKQGLAVGSVHGVTSGDVDVLVWKDRNVVSLISTYHGAASASRDGRTKPTLVNDYNVHMGGVDKKDQMLSSYPIERKRTSVWYKKFFRRLLNASVLNAYILHKDSPQSKRLHPRFVNHRNFRKTLIKQILGNHSKQQHVVMRPVDKDSKIIFSREMIRHFPTTFSYNEKLKQLKRGHCNICQKRTQIQCTSCNTALCLAPCFVKYHS